MYTHIYKFIFSLENPMDVAIVLLEARPCKLKAELGTCSVEIRWRRSIAP